MRRAILGLAAFVVVGACGWAAGCAPASEPPYSITGGSGTNLSTGGGSQTQGAYDAGLSDGGVEADAGLPATTCPGDVDGTSNGTGLVISELSFLSRGYIELYNRGPSSVDLGTYAFAGAFNGDPVGTATLISTGRTVEAATLPSPTGELGLYAPLGDGGYSLVFYVCWGQLGTTTLQNQATTLGLWYSNSVCPAVPTQGNTLHLRGVGTSASDWVAAPPSPNGCADGN